MSRKSAWMGCVKCKRKVDVIDAINSNLQSVRLEVGVYHFLCKSCYCKWKKIMQLYATKFSYQDLWKKFLNGILRIIIKEKVVFT